MKHFISVFFFSLLFVCNSIYGQEIFDVRNQAKNNLKVLQEGLKKYAPEAVLSNTQLVKLEKVFIKSNQEKEDLIKAGAHKSDYAVQVVEIDQKYYSAIESILSTKQRTALRKMTEDNKVKVNQ